LLEILGLFMGQNTAVPIPYKIALGIYAAQNMMAVVEWNQRQI
jgi:hypothetical protein